jgi:hypothetical protein
MVAVGGQQKHGVVTMQRILAPLTGHDFALASIFEFCESGGRSARTMGSTCAVVFLLCVHSVKLSVPADSGFGWFFVLAEVQSGFSGWEFFVILRGAIAPDLFLSSLLAIGRTLNLASEVRIRLSACLLLNSSDRSVES